MLAMIILPKYMGVSGVYWGSFMIDLFIVALVVVLMSKDLRSLVAREKIVGCD